MAHRRLLVLVTVVAALLLGTHASAPRGPATQPPKMVPASRALVAILSYHDLSDDPTSSPLTVSPEFLRSQIRAAKAQGWTFLKLSDLVARFECGAELPERVMVLTFDDGCRSFLDLALPILQAESVPATLAIVTSFATTPPADLPALLSWKQIAELEQSGLVEIASHSHDLHHWVTDNAFGDTTPSVTTRRYLPAERRYEDRDEYRQRIRRDMSAAQATLRHQLGHGASVYVWPYGEFNEMARALAAEAGFELTLALGDRAVRAEDFRSGTLPRVLVTRHTRFSADDMRWLTPAPTAVRAAQVDLDSVFDPDDAACRRNVDAVVARVRAIGATHVILAACADPAGDGMFREAWFANHQLPVKADVWSMVAAKLHHAGMRVWIRAPVLNLSWAWTSHPEWRVAQDPKARQQAKPWYFRLSPDVPEARQAAFDFYADMAVYLPIDGVLFDDDAFMLPHEALRQSGSTDPRAKSEAMREMIDGVMRTVRSWRPNAKFGRKLYAPAAEHDGVHPMYAQDLDQFLRDYDLTVVMAYAHMEGHGDDAAPWIHRLVRKTLTRWNEARPAPILFKLQAYDWKSRGWLPGDALMSQVLEARKAGAAHLGVYPVEPADGSIPDGLLAATLRTSMEPVESAAK